MTGKFLTAEWRKLIMANYIVDPAILKPYLPPGTEPDSFDNKHYVSLVAFMFLETRVMNFKIPFHVNFPEVNLRFYVRYNDLGTWKRGVVFIREIVPKPAISFVANAIYGEKYISLPVTHQTCETDSDLILAYKWKFRSVWNELSVVADKQAEKLQPGSQEEFITEHFWGYTSSRSNILGEYQVAHPRWDLYPIRSYKVDCDFAALYGSEFAHLKSEAPASVFLAEGSPISIFKKKLITKV
jgi:hypothetical protein